MQNKIIFFETKLQNMLNEENVFFNEIKDKIQKQLKLIQNEHQAKQYILKLHQNIKKLPPKIKIKILKYVLATAILTFGFQKITQNLPKDLQKISISAAKESISSADKQIYPTKASEEIKNFIKKEESLKLKAYTLGDGKITIGWGHAEDIKDSKLKKGDEITKEQASQYFEQDIKEAEDGLNRIFKAWSEVGINVEINQDMYDAMVSMVFNMGIGNFRMSEFIQLVKSNQMESAAEKILTTNTKGFNGLKKRRKSESNYFKRGILRLKMKDVFNKQSSISNFW
jgi:GH24 family phage-related lysozyme (muramidase)